MKKNLAPLASLTLVASTAFIVGCPAPAPPAPKPITPVTQPITAPKDATKHAAHGEGPHEGAVADWGGGKYHVEFTVDHDKQEATVYVLGDDEKTAAPIKAEKILLSINAPKFQVDLVAAPQEGEADGKASRFVGKHESLGKVQEFAGSISGEVEGTPYVGDFKEEPHDTPAAK
ncbi:MAG: hypothetical protein Q8K78_09325 [Planctomycetaceae bacterium]|nr:hypothetical protein [Planctomycetaceae bacterium]